MKLRLKDIENKTDIIYYLVIDSILDIKAESNYEKIILRNLFLYSLEYFYNNSDQIKPIMKSVKKTKELINNWLSYIKQNGISKFITKMELPL